MTALETPFTLPDKATQTLEPDLTQATTFLQWLDPMAQGFTFQTFDDNADRKSPNLVAMLHGTLDQHAGRLEALNRQGAGVFVTVNETDLKGRKAENITRVRAVFADTDGAPLEPIQAHSMKPNGITDSSPGKWHPYWLVEGLPLDEFEPIQSNIASMFGTDPKVKDLPRVMRLPGFYHRKAEPYLVTFKAQSPSAYSAEQVRRAFPVPEQAPAPANTAAFTLPSSTNIHPYAARARESALAAIVSAPDGCRNQTLNDEAFGLFGLVKGGHLPEHDTGAALERAAIGAGLTPTETAATLASARKAAQPRDIEEPPMNKPGREDSLKGIDTATKDDKDTAPGIDLLNPPGLAGEVCRLLMETARRPRPELYPLAALHLMALVGRKRQGHYLNKLNLLTLAIAPTAAGKEKAQDTIKRLAKQQYCSNLIHGNAGSFKDMVHNLLDGDGGSLYVVDEVHSFLDTMKSKNAQTYESKMEAEILTMNSTELYTFRGLEKRQLEDIYTKRISQAETKLEDAEGDTEQTDKLRRAVENAKNRLEWLENGLPDPFFSMMGHSVPERLDSFIKLDNIASGFLGRTLVVRCPETREKLKRQPVDEHAVALMEQNIAEGLQRIRRSTLTVKPDTEAAAYLDECVDWYDADEQLNHHLLGGLFARAPEHLYRIATILGLEGGTITLEHAQYAHALVKQSLEDVRYILLKAYADSEQAEEKAVIEHARQTIHRHCKDGERLSVIKQIVTKPKGWQALQAKDVKRDRLAELLERMEASGELEKKKDGRRERYVSRAVV